MLPRIQSKQDLIDIHEMCRNKIRVTKSCPCLYDELGKCWFDKSILGTPCGWNTNKLDSLLKSYLCYLIETGK